MAEKQSSPSLQDRVADWLSTQGYPLEFEAASCLQQAGMRAFLGQHFEDEDGTPREVDVSANTEPLSLTVGGFTNVSAQLIVECKWSGNNPWVLLCQSGAFAPIQLFGMAALSADAQAPWMARIIAPERRTNELDWLALPDLQHIGYSVVAALKSNKDNRDVPYTVMKKLANAANFYKAQLRRKFEPVMQGIGPFSFWNLVIPCILLDGPLFAASFAPSPPGFELRPIDYGRIHWTTSSPISICIVTRKAFPRFAAHAHEVLARFTKDSYALALSTPRPPSRQAADGR